MSILGMHPCEGTEAVPPHARSHTVLLSGQFPGDERALVRWVELLLLGHSRLLADLLGVPWHRLLNACCCVQHASNRVACVLVPQLGQQSLACLPGCRLSFGMSGDGEVAMKVVSRGDSEAVSEMVHSIIQEA